MEKEFVPYDLAVKLKELGFDEGCLAMHRANNGLYGDGTSVYGYYEDGSWQLAKNSDYCDGAPGWSAAPTFSQAFKWFRKNYMLYHDIHKGFGFFGGYITLEENRHDPRQDKIVPYHIPKYYGTHNSYEEAELACLTKLIEIVEQQSKR